MSGDPRSAPEGTTRRIPSLPDGWRVVSYAILSNGDLGILGADVDLSEEWRLKRRGDPFGKAAGARAAIWIFDGSQLLPGPSFQLLSPLPAFDRFPDGRWLVAAVRSDEANGRILGPDGDERNRIRLGDGIMHMQIDETGLIWVGWFDEGVFGNEGWRTPGRKWPPSGFGLAAFSEKGELTSWAADPPKGSEIADCYALNVAGEQAVPTLIFPSAYQAAVRPPAGGRRSSPEHGLSRSECRTFWPPAATQATATGRSCFASRGAKRRFSANGGCPLIWGFRLRSIWSAHGAPICMSCGTGFGIAGP